jgi:hypothetical protein
MTRRVHPSAPGSTATSVSRALLSARRSTDRLRLDRSRSSPSTLVLPLRGDVHLQSRNAIGATTQRTMKAATHPSLVFCPGNAASSKDINCTNWRIQKIARRMAGIRMSRNASGANLKGSSGMAVCALADSESSRLILTQVSACHNRVIFRSYSCAAPETAITPMALPFVWRYTPGSQRGRDCH